MDNLSLFKCKNCGGELDVRLAVNGVIECKYCHTPWTVPKEETASEAVKYLHDGTAALDVCKFEDAFTYFQKAAEADNNEPEAYFGMALAQFKVQYLKDEVNNCLQPICHEISEKVFTEDKNYKKALELATVEQKRVYRRKGGEIDDIRDEIFALQNSGLSYDCFLCVKVTEEDGTHTEDYNRANDIYYHLKDKGYKPFYSEREMKGRTGSAYEALILYALYTSECMLIVCSDEDYLQTKWVKNEYSRFISMMSEGGKERDALTFVFAGKPIEKLPNGKKIQGIDLSKPDAYSRITEYIESHTPEAKKRRKEEAETKLAEEEARRKAFEEQQKLIEEQKRELERLREQGGGESAQNDELLRELRLAREAREKEEAEKKRLEEEVRRQEEEARRREEEERIAREKAETERREKEEAARRAREEEERKRHEEAARRAYLAQFEIQNGVLLKYKGNGGNVVIPDGVTSIGDRAFVRCTGLTKVTIPNTVTSIGEAAFGGCSGLTKITIPDSVTSIGGWAFNGCTNLTEITVPNSVKEIGAAAFERCVGLTWVGIPNSVNLIGDYAFEFCSNLKNVTIPKRFDTGFMHSNLKKLFGDSYKNIQFTFI